MKRHTVLGSLIAAIPSLEMQGVVTRVAEAFAGCADVHAWVLLDASLYPTVRPRLTMPSTAEAMDAWLDIVGSALGPGDTVRITVFGRGDSFELATVRTSARFAVWAAALMQPSWVIHVVIVAGDRALHLQRMKDTWAAAIGDEFHSRLVEACARKHEAGVAHGRDVEAKLRALLAAQPGVTVLDAAPDPRFDARLFDAIPIGDIEPARRRHVPREAGPDAWFAAQYARLDAGHRAWVTTHGTTAVEIALADARDASWLNAVWRAQPPLCVVSSDGARTLTLWHAEYDDEAYAVPTAALADRAHSRETLRSRLDTMSSVRPASIRGMSVIDPAAVFDRAHRMGRVAVVDEARARAWLGTLGDDVRPGPWPHSEAARDGAVGWIELSVGSIAPLAWTGALVFDDGAWLATLWNTGLARLLITSPSMRIVLGLRRDGDATEVFGGPPGYA